MDMDGTLTESLRWGLAGLVVLLGAFAGLAARRGLRKRQLRRHRDAQAIAAALVEGAPEPEPEPEPDVVLRAVPPLLALLCLIVAVQISGLASLTQLVTPLERVLQYRLFDLGARPVTPMTALVVLTVISVGLFASRWIQKGLAAALTSKNRADEGVIAALQRLAHYAVLLVAIIVALQTAGFDLSALVAASAVFAVGLGFGMQQVVNNFIAGLLLLMERSIKPGDLLSVEGRLVRVVELGIRATIGRTLDDDDVIIPNGKLIENYVINHSLREDRIRARVNVGVAYESDLDLVQRTLERVARRFPHRVQDKEPVVNLVDFGSSSVDFEVSVWVADAWVRPRMLSQLRHAIWKALKEAEVTIAFPQLDVHFDAPVVEALGARGQRDQTSSSSRA